MGQPQCSSPGKYLNIQKHFQPWMVVSNPLCCFNEKKHFSIINKFCKCLIASFSYILILHLHFLWNSFSHKLLKFQSVFFPNKISQLTLIRSPFLPHPFRSHKQKCLPQSLFSHIHTYTACGKLRNSEVDESKAIIIRINNWQNKGNFWYSDIGMCLKK